MMRSPKNNDNFRKNEKKIAEIQETELTYMTIVLGKAFYWPKEQCESLNSKLVKAYTVKNWFGNF
jgi:hypothetical protein